jgi:hypothetical protein
LVAIPHGKRTTEKSKHKWEENISHHKTNEDMTKLQIHQYQLLYINTDKIIGYHKL